MKTETTNTQNMLPDIAESEAIHIAAAEDAGFERMLKFKKGDAKTAGMSVLGH